MKSEKGVSVKVADDFYRMMERIRIQLRNKHNIRVKSHVKLTKLMAKNYKVFQNKKWIDQIKKWNY